MCYAFAYAGVTNVKTSDFGSMEKKRTDKEKSHKGIWLSGCPGGVPGTNSDVPGTPGTFGTDLCVYQY